MKGTLVLINVAGPFTTEVSQTLKIRNPNHAPVAFKVHSYTLLLWPRAMANLYIYRSRQPRRNSMSRKLLSIRHHYMLTS
jgi:hypothetical protein